MASELRVNTLKDASGNNSVALSTVANGSAKAWANFDMDGTQALNDSFNASSISDVATGKSTISYTNSMSNVNYSCVTNSVHDSGSYFTTLNVAHDTPPTASAVQLEAMVQNTGAHVDAELNSMANHGDLA
jgi:hypothetical protein